MIKIKMICCLSFIFFILLLTGCFNSTEEVDLGEEDNIDDIVETPNESTLRILIPTMGDGSQGMIQDINETYLPDLKYEFVFFPINTDNYLEAFAHYLEEEDIDLLFPGFYYNILAERGYLYPLDDLMMDTDFKLEEIHPAVLQQYQVGGEVFGLSPSFHTHVIYYNKDIFEQLEIEPPTDQMTWEEILVLAADVTARNEAVTGIKVTFPFLFFQHFAVSHHLGYFVEEASDVRLEVDSEDWKKAWEMLQHGFEESYVDFLHSFEVGVDIGFINGDAAMAFSDMGLIYDLHERDDIQWEIVTEPVHPANRNESISLSPFSPLSINRQSANIELAWSVVKTYNSSEVAAEFAQDGRFQLFSRTSYINVNQDFNAQAFFSLQRGSRHYNDVYEGMPLHFDSETFTASAMNELNGVIHGRKAIEEALENLQDLGEKLLYQAINKEQGLVEGDSDEYLNVKDDEEEEWIGPYDDRTIGIGGSITR